MGTGCKETGPGEKMLEPSRAGGRTHGNEPNGRSSMRLRALLLAVAFLCTGWAAPAQNRSALQQAYDAYTEKRYADSARLFAEAIEKGATDQTTLYNAACSAALAGDEEQAFRFLDRAVAAGWRDVAHLRADPDLVSFRDDPRWKGVVARAEEAEKAYLASINAELYRIYTEDQGDRAGGPEKIDWKVVSERDKKRRERVREMLAEGSVKAADDYFHAAMVFQHGDTPDDYQRAHELASKAAEMNPSHRVARWLAAAAKDRYLWSVGKPQIYGTQFKKTSPDGPWTIDPIDETAVSDEDRKKAGVPTLAETRKRLDQMNAAEAKKS